jgi:hypothetical protein
VASLSPFAPFPDNFCITLLRINRLFVGIKVLLRYPEVYHQKWNRPARRGYHPDDINLSEITSANALLLITGTAVYKCSNTSLQMVMESQFGFQR